MSKPGGVLTSQLQSPEAVHNQILKAGILARSPAEHLPMAQRKPQWLTVQQSDCPRGKQNLQLRDSSGITPDSLLISLEGKPISAAKIGAFNHIPRIQLTSPHANHLQMNQDRRNRRKAIIPEHKQSQNSRTSPGTRTRQCQVFRTPLNHPVPFLQ